MWWGFEEYNAMLDPGLIRIQFEVMGETDSLSPKQTPFERWVKARQDPAVLPSCFAYAR